MGYQLRMHHEIRDWLTELRVAEPELARLVGEAVLALLDAGETVEPPLVVPLESVLWPPDDPREVLDCTYQRQLEMLTKVRRGVADVATSRKRVELQVSTLQQQAVKLASQRERALAAGDEVLASEARSREAGIQQRLSELHRQMHTLTGQEERLTLASQRLQAKVEDFRVQKETIKATYTAAEGSQRVREAFAEMGADASELEETDVEADAASGFGSTSTAEDRLQQQIRELVPPFPGNSTGEEDVQAPPGMMELRAGAPGYSRAGLLFVVEPPDTAVLVSWVEDPGGSRRAYREAVEAATARLTVARPDAPEATTAPPAAFTSYDAESFLDEFFPGAETEVEIGAGTLVARNRAHTLAEARQRMTLTQAQVAERMNVRQERVSAIERAEPGATEVRTLAAYVRALGGRLEIIADIGGERIMLR
ncbi:MAG: phage shock protein [Streptosporangiaceae bacterium]|nr:phage shock protein [Streptosporangiaceae bacterium]